MKITNARDSITAPSLSKKGTTMKLFAITTVTAGVLAAASMGFAGVAGAAAVSNPGNAQDTINSLQAQGYSVQLNGKPNIPLRECTVAGIHGLPNADSAAGGPTVFTTVYVDISCPADDEG